MYKDYAMIIGINDYTPPEKKGLRTLNAAVRDAQDFAQWFLHESDGGDADRCKTVYSKSKPLAPIHDEIDEKLRELLYEAEKEPAKNRRLYFYFAGHGKGVEFDPTNNALCMADWSESMPNKALSSRKYHDVLINFGLFQQVIILLDCCRDIKTYVSPQDPSFNAIPGLGPHQAEVFLGYSTIYDNLSYELITDEGENRGLFTSLLLKGLRGAASNEDGIINSASLKKYLDKNIPEETKGKRYKQKPDIKDGLTESNSVFAKVQADKQVPCIIHFDHHRAGSIELVGGGGNTIRIFSNVGGKDLPVQLKKGLYLLKDESNHYYKPFLVDAYSETDTSHSIMVINF